MMNNKARALLFIWISLIAIPAGAQSFVTAQQASSDLPDVSEGSAVWADVNQDGLLDVLLAGNWLGDPFTGLFLQQNGGFSNAGINLVELSGATVAFCDYNADNLPDIFVTGLNDSGLALARLYKNNGAAYFEETNAPIEGLGNACVKFTDLDNDGDQDIILMGDKGGVGATLLYSNLGNDAFEAVENNLTDLFEGELDTEDYDLDGDHDIVIIGRTVDLQGNSQKVLELYKNMGNFSFQQVYSGWVGMNFSNVQWGDYDMDGDPDVLANGSTNAPTHLVYIYKNQGNDEFLNIGIEIFGTINGSINWGDFDSDGDLDFLLTGNTSLGSGMPATEIYQNQGGDLFNKADNTGLPPFYNSCARWGDYDLDGDLDLLMAGQNPGSATPQTAVYQNVTLAQNSLPTVPLNQSATVNGSSVTFNWDPASDQETAWAGLTYNLEINNLMPSLSNNEGLRIIPQPGNAGHNLQWQVSNLEPGAYSWRLQSVDNHFAGSAFTQQQLFFIATTGQNDVTAQPSAPLFTLYPNPFKGRLNIMINVGDNPNLWVEVFDFNGVMVYKEFLKCVKNIEQKWVWNGYFGDGTPAEPGIYFVRITDDLRSEYRLVLKTN